MDNKFPKKTVFKSIKFSREQWFGFIMLGALLAFEAFNFATTEFSLRDLLGDLTFLGIRWSLILTTAFSGIDLGGLARLFTPQTGDDEPAEVWYIFGAWVLGAVFNATLTWWGVYVAMVQNPNIDKMLKINSGLLDVVPVGIALLVFVLRIILITTFTTYGEHVLGIGNKKREERKEEKKPDPIRMPQPEHKPTPQHSTYKPQHRPQLGSKVPPSPQRPPEHRRPDFDDRDPTYRMGGLLAGENRRQEKERYDEKD